MKIRIDEATRIVLQDAIKSGELDTLSIPELYDEQLNYFADLLVRANQVDDKIPDEQRNM